MYKLQPVCVDLFLQIYVRHFKTSSYYEKPKGFKPVLVFKSFNISGYCSL